MERFQEDFDFKKWLESEAAKKDLCGTYNFCNKCDKKLERPCEKAYLASKKIKRRVLTFSEKLALANDLTKERFNNIVAYLENENIKCHVCKSYTSIKVKNKLIGKLTLTRNSLKCHLAIKPSKYPNVTHLDYSDKKTYVDYPFTIKINTKIAIKNIVTLAKKIKV